jgi:3-deoxy-D-manno-octulosonate 8-phosphate phosphatase KdsC-like HAD superfamily phosphatase
MGFIPKKKLRKGDVATVVDYHPVQNGEDGYSLEIFNAVGETVAVITVTESAIKALSKEEVFNVRLLLAA